jgi:hypothetical protein
VITRRSVLLAGGIGLLVAHRSGRGQSATSVRRVGWLSLGSKAGTANVYAAFKQGMHDLGWLEGKNVECQVVYADADVGSLDALASELIRQKVDVIVVGNATTTRALQRATKTTSIVMANVNNPVGNGFVASLAKPGGNITGITTQGEELLGKLIGILHEVTPGARRVAIMLNESNPNHPVFWVAAQRACSALDLIALRIARQYARAIRCRRRRNHPAAITGRRGGCRPHLPLRARQVASADASHSSAGSVWVARACGREWLAVLRARPRRVLSQRGEVSGQDSEGRQARGSSRRAGE